jgi:hypothetical protein
VNTVRLLAALREVVVGGTPAETPDSGPATCESRNLTPDSGLEGWLEPRSTPNPRRGDPRCSLRVKCHRSFTPGAGGGPREPRSLETHLARMFERFGIATRTELATRALREGWLDLPPD